MNNRTMPIHVDGYNFTYLWQDLETNMQLTVFYGNVVWASKKFHFNVDTGEGVVIHTIRSFLREQGNVENKQLQ